MEAMKVFYATVIKKDKKERFEMILEPFQAMIQLALLSYYPTGSKLSLNDNILVIQEPTWSQSMQRNYNRDGRNDLIYLFRVISRFRKFYGHLSTGKPKYKELFGVIISRAKAGLGKLVQTYETDGASHLSHTLRMYQRMVDGDAAISKDDCQEGETPDIDDVFSNVTELYSHEHYVIVNSVFALLGNHESRYKEYSACINSCLSPVCLGIRKWISENVVY